MHKKLLTFFLAIAFAIGTGCAPKVIHKNWEASGGSRADATVEVGFTYDPLREKAETNDAQALEQAIRRCQAWGYTDAEPFGLVKTTCQRMEMIPFSGMVCTNMLVTRQYQCLGTATQSSGGYSGTRNNFSSDPNFVGPMKPGKKTN